MLQFDKNFRSCLRLTKHTSTMPLSLEDATNPANQASQASQIPPPNAASILETIIEESDNGHMLNFVSH